jgi:hypothetical protein
MSFNSIAFLAYHERLLNEPVTGTKRYREPQRAKYIFPVQPVELSEYERARREDENIERHILDHNKKQNK